MERVQAEKITLNCQSNEWMRNANGFRKGETLILMESAVIV